MPRRRAQKIAVQQRNLNPALDLEMPIVSNWVVVDLPSLKNSKSLALQFLMFGQI